MSGATSSTYSSANIAIPYLAPDNVPANAKPYIQPIYTAFQNLIQVLINNGGIAPRPASAILSSVNDPTAILSDNVHRFYTIALEDIQEAAAVNLFAPSGVLFARNASATDMAHRCDGFCSQSGGLVAGQAGEFILNDGVILEAIAGLVPGARYYLSPSAPGGYTETPPSTAGQIVQYLGIAITNTSFRFLTGEPKQL